MDIPVLPIFIALTATFVAISLLRSFAISINLVDYPSNRKQHTGSVPLIGGIAMYIGLVVSILLAEIDLNKYNNYFNYHMSDNYFQIFLKIFLKPPKAASSMRAIYLAFFGARRAARFARTAPRKPASSCLELAVSWWWARAWSVTWPRRLLTF